MGLSIIPISVACTALSFAGIQYWTQLSPFKFISNGLTSEDLIHSGSTTDALELLFGSYADVVLGASLGLNVFLLVIICVKAIFFVELYSSEARKLVEHLINYVIYKGTFLPLVVPPTVYQAGLWSTWLAVLCSLKMFQALARDRLERLNASPLATPWTYFRVYSVLLLVLSIDILWIRMCLIVHKTINPAMVLLLFFEPLSIAFETLQAIVVHGFQLLDIWLHHSAGDITNCHMSKYIDISATGSLLEWKGLLIRNLGFFIDMMTLLMALGHYVHIWWLHGMAFHLVDAVLFLKIHVTFFLLLLVSTTMFSNTHEIWPLWDLLLCFKFKSVCVEQALLSAILKRIKGFIKLRRALGALHRALPDATSKEIQSYDDECAICREPMTKAKKLPCHHLFHLACLRSWLDQGLSDNYSCPTCRKSLIVSGPDDELSPRIRELSSDEQLARQINSGLDAGPIHPPLHTLPTGIFPNQAPSPLESGDWRGTGIDSSWMGFDGAGPSTAMRSVGFGRVQMMMRQLAAVGETYAQTALEDTSWRLWPMNPSSHASTSTPSTSSVSPVGDSPTVRYPGTAGGSHMRTTNSTTNTVPHAANDDIAVLLAMAETVREVLPHIPDELIYQDLLQTHSVAATVNNLLQM